MHLLLLTNLLGRGCTQEMTMTYLFIVKDSRSQFTSEKEDRTKEKYLVLKVFGFSSDSAMNILTIDNLLNPGTFGFIYRTKVTKIF